MFENSQEYYEYLEKDTGLLFDFKLSNEVLNLRDKIDDVELKAHCSYELFFTDFIINNGKIKPKMTLATGQTYPDFALFDDNFAYIKLRAENVENPKYKAKYNHLLWESKYKHNNYAYKAIDNYFAFIKSVSFASDDNLSHHAFQSYFNSLFILSQAVNHRKEEVLQYLISIIGSKKINGYKEYSLMQFILEEGKKIEKVVLQTFFDYSNKVTENSIFPDLAREYLQLLILLSPKLNISPKPYHNKLAEFYVADSKEQKENFVVHDFYLKALTHYQKAGNKKMIEEVSVLTEKAKRNINLKTVKIEHTDQRLQEYWSVINKFTDELTEKGQSKDIYEYITHSDRMFPKAEALTSAIRPVMFDLINVVTFDINKNVSGSEKSGLNSYFLHIQNFSLRQLWMVFSKGIKNDKISHHSLIEFLQNNSWYGQNFTYRNADGEIEGFNWIELLSPSLLSFFLQSEIDIKLNKSSYEGYILAIDSLVIKFEGLLREFSRNIGAQTIEIKENGTEERISFEKLLDNEKLNALIPKDDVALFRFLFTSDGMNLRNNIAHCFYKTNDYSAGKGLLLIAALLKLGKYKFERKE